MQRLSLAILTLLIWGSVVVGHAYDLPEVLVLIEGYPEDSSVFGLEFTCIGDQNGDGYDDLMVNHDPMRSSSRIHYWDRLNRVELFNGGEEMDDEPDFLFTNDDSLVSVGERICFVGNIMPDRNQFVILQNTLTGPRQQEIEFHLNFFELGDELDNEP
ncbi:MAG: hypothetical protein P9M15_06005, partial [Candidatus Electryoneaceae bacterium]|nr:hypothetical protein [Candidatus Electryoneaceae bacterium]